MGTAICTEQEIYDELEKALNSLQGEVYKSDTKKAFNKLCKEYEYFTK